MNRSSFPLIALTAVFMSFPLLLLYQHSGSSAIMLDKEKSIALTALRQQHAILSERVLSIRSGFEQNFDALASSQQQVHEGFNQVAISLQDNQTRAKKLLQQLQQYHEQRLIAVERFKSLHAKLTNSLRYLPQVQHRLLLQPELSIQQKQQLSQLSLLLINNHSYTDPDEYRKLNALLINTASLGQTIKLPLLDNLILHGEHLLQFKQQENAILQEILTSPISLFFDQLNQQLIRDHDHNIIAAERLKYFLVFYSSALIVLILAFLINRYQLNQRLRRHKHLSEKDQLTGLNNRRYFLEQLQSSINHKNGYYGALIFIDLDGFKAINDHLGHSEGDNVLRHMATRLSDYCSELAGTLKTVTVTPARLGGDEFVILLSGLDAGDAEQQVTHICDTVLKRLSQPISDYYQPYPLSGSLGVAFFPSHGTCVADIMHAADRAMYHSKEHGKNTYSLYHPNMAENRKKQCENKP